MGFNYFRLPKCEGCTCPTDGYPPKGRKYDCAMYWRPGTGTKTGFPRPDGWECPRDSWDKIPNNKLKMAGYPMRRRRRK